MQTIKDGEPRLSISTFTQFFFSVALHPETSWTIRDGEPRTSTWTFTQLFGVALCPETMQTIKDGVPKSSTWTFTQLFFNVALRPQKPCRLLRMGNLGLPPRLSRSFTSMWLYVHRDLVDYKGRGAQDVHLDFHTAPEL